MRRATWPKTTLMVTLAVLAAFGAGELFYRLIKPTALDFQSQFRPYPYRIDANGRFVFGWPHYKGFMRPMGTDRNAPLELDANGIRPPVTTPGTPPGDRKQVLVLGGSSQTFGFGLRNEDTWPARMAFHACEPLMEHIYVHPGQNSWHGYAHFEFTAKKPFKPDYIVLSNYEEYIWPLGGRFVPRPTQVSSLVVIRGWYYSRQWYHAGFLRHSALINRVMTSELLRDAVKVWATVGSFARALAAPAPPAVDAPGKEIVGIENYVSYLEFLQHEAEGYGAKLLIALMPSSGRGDYFARLKKATPEDIPVLDLHLELDGTPMQRELLADGHWNERLTDHLGRRVAEKLCELKE